MKRLFAFPLMVLSMSLVLFAAGCSDDDPVVPEQEAYLGLEGQVVDGDGNPVADAAIGIIYDLPLQEAATGKPREKAASKIDFSVADPGSVHVWLTDYADEYVATLVDEELPAGSHSVLWYATDDEGNRVPVGLYTCHVEMSGEPPTAMDVFVAYLDPLDFLDAPSAVTDADGRFRIPDSLIPIGATLGGVDETNETTVSFTIGSTLRLVAVRDADPDPVWVRITVEYREGAANAGLEIQLP